MDCPYRGLLPFREQDSELFFGRDRFLFGEEESKTGLIKAVHTQPIVAVIGSSGSGKSSVIFAGLIPRLREEGTWLIETFRPQNQPFDRLAAALVRLLEPELGKIQQLSREVDLAINMTQGKLRLSQAASKILEASPRKRLLLVIDQFEEIYTSCPSETQDQFVSLLLDAATTDKLTLVLTLRADFYSYVLSYRPFCDAMQRFTPQLLGSMNREELQSTIEKPLEKLGVSLEPKLTERILDDVGKEPGNLPLLEFALSELWKKQQNERLTHNAYNEIGGVKKAIANHAEKIYGQLDEVQQKQAQYIFTQLAYPGRGTEDTRRLATSSEIGDENWDLVNYLAHYRERSTDYNARLLVTGWDEGKNEKTVEIVHDALIREWKRLQDWMNDDRKFRTWQESIRFSVQSWRDSRRDKSALLRGMLLVEAETWLKQRSFNISLSERQFIEKSKQREKLTQYGLTTLGIIFTSLLIFAQRQFSERQFQEQLSAVLIGGSASPELIHILPRTLQIANQQANKNDTDGAIATYQSTLRAAQNFRRFMRENPKRFQMDDREKIDKIWKEAESSLARMIIEFRLFHLKEELRNGSIGNLRNGARLTQYEDKYTKGALKTTYRIIMRKYGVGADFNGDGLLSSPEEAELIPCNVLIEIENLWREFTKSRKCGWYGAESYLIEPSCDLLSGQTLTKQIFSYPQEIAIDHISSCPGIRKPIKKEN